MTRCSQGNWRDRESAKGNSSRDNSGGWRGKHRNGTWESNSRGDRRIGRRDQAGRERQVETPQQEQAKEAYHAWKRMIKRPPRDNDFKTVENIWKGALGILETDQRHWKQMVAKDLDDQENFGLEHIKTIMCMQTDESGYYEFIGLGNLFLQVITHSEFMESLSVDMFVGNLYTFIGGSDGIRALSFMNRLTHSLVEISSERVNFGSTEVVESSLIAMIKALREIMKRQPRTAFNPGFPRLVEAIETAAHCHEMERNEIHDQVLKRLIREVRGIIARTNGLLDQEERVHVRGLSAPAPATRSSYPRDIVLPQNRHDNDKLDITSIKILPTEDEIRSIHPEFLPSTDFDQPHFLTDPRERHLDTQFRLLRSDIFGELKDSLSNLMTAVETNPELLENPKLSLGSTRAYAYPGAHITYVSFSERRRCLETQISFRQPAMARKSTSGTKKSSSERRRWWEESKRLQEGVLLCLLYLKDGKASILFFTVSEKRMESEKGDLTSDAHQASITARLATQGQIHLESMVQISCDRVRGVLVEIPGVLLATFTPVLESLQNMQRLCRLPFREWILPHQLTGSSRADTVAGGMPPPLYARTANFTFPLKSILKEGAQDMSLSSTASVSDSATVDMIETQTGLDRGQCQALIAALTREFAFIQGPPGTGKSYLGVKLMQVLLDCRKEAKLGPIVVVCYTNHALDQFLEHLINVGVKKLIRIGGQSHSDMLETLNLRVVSQEHIKTRGDAYSLAMSYQALEELQRKLKSTLGALYGSQKHPTWQNMKWHLKEKYPKIYNQFSREDKHGNMVDKDGFTVVGGTPFDVWNKELPMANLQRQNETGSSSTETLDQLLDSASQDAYCLSQIQRRCLLQFWIEQLRRKLSDQLFELAKEADKISQNMTNIHDDVDVQVLSTAEVIGVTTTGLAKRIATLQNVKSKVVICEEAGEVMEPHILSAFLPDIEHFIQIGDHQQLRPQINNYNLSLESKKGQQYQLDRSQFERLSVDEPGRPRLPLAQLNIQRRMRPEISRLIRETVYPRLLDHPSTKAIPDVVGMRNNVFWLDHDHYEDGGQSDAHNKSHSNNWEIEMTHALVRHIVRQGVYDSSEIAVLTPYTGQLQKLRSKMRMEFEIVLSDLDQDTLAKDGYNDDDLGGNDQVTEDHTRKPLQRKKLSELLRLATVDNFQGEEAKIIIVSLVRSNQEKKVGFLRTTNRINVLLSRAQHGMYLIGNLATYSNIPMWAQVCGMLRAEESIGTSLSLRCPRHPDTRLEASEPEDLARLSPEGGCQLACDRRLPDCGHRCQAKCHSEAIHRVFNCPQPCQRLHKPCNHGCQKATCGEDCGVCLIAINGVQLPCGHAKDNVHCYLAQDPAKLKCNVSVEKQVPACGHRVKVACWRDTSSPSFRCPTPCNDLLSCGHMCTGLCSGCIVEENSDEKKHKKCEKVCGRRFGTCNHTCPRECHDGSDCGSCQSACEVRCVHSRCTLKCHEGCAPCIEKCNWSCEHKGGCNMPCAAPCNRLPCNKRCSRFLQCGHRCPGICGETCPEGYCQICSKRQNDRVDLLEMKLYKEIDLMESPIVALACGHFFTAESLDGLVGMGEVYEQDMRGEFTRLHDLSAALASNIPRCPDCQRPIRQHTTQRYNRVINRAVIDEMTKRFLVTGKTDLQKLDKEIESLDGSLQASRAEIVNIVNGANDGISRNKRASINSLTSRVSSTQGKIELFQHRIRKFLIGVADKNQPAQKLYEATVSAFRDKPINQAMSDLRLNDSVLPITYDRRVTFGARGVQLKFAILAVDHHFSIYQELGAQAAGDLKLSGKSFPNTFHTFFKECQTFINDCALENLPKLEVEASIYYARAARSYQTYSCSIKSGVDKASDYIATSKQLLENAKATCAQKFQNADSLYKVAEEFLILLGREWYQAISPDELASIKTAMLDGSQGIATHSGHWYKCFNGHTFAVGECGMPMELARCPECGSLIGGRNHTAVEGVTRAMDMES